MKIYFVEREPRADLFPAAFSDHDVRFASELKFVGADAQIIAVFIHSIINGRFLDEHPNLTLISTRSTAVDHIDMEECRKRGITICYVPSYGDNTVAEHTFALILALSRRIREAREASKTGRFSLSSVRGFDLLGKTLGVIGAGKTGLRVIRFAKAFDMEVIAYDIDPQEHLQSLLGFEYVTLNELLARSRVISLHCPLTVGTYHLLNREAFAKCLPGVVIVNTARGRLIDTAALIQALDAGLVAGAGLDVIEEERVMTRRAATIMTESIVERLHSTPQLEEASLAPLRVAELQALMENAELIGRPNVVFTPHIAFNSVEAIERIDRTTIDNIRGFLDGEPVNVAI